MANGTRWMDARESHCAVPNLNPLPLIVVCCRGMTCIAADRLVPPWVGSRCVKESIHDKAPEVTANARITPVSREVGYSPFIAREITIAIDRSPARINIYRWAR